MTPAQEMQLVVQDVSKAFGGLNAVANVSFALPPAAITTLIGPNGAGKTTLFNIIGGRIRPDSGSIVFHGGRIDRRPSYAIAKRGLARTFQHTRVLAKMSVLDNVRVAAMNHPGERLQSVFGWTPSARRREREVTERALDLLELVRLKHQAREYAGALSGGQRKLLEFARIMMAEPAMILLDEPMAGVNRVVGRQLIQHVVDIRRSHQTGFLLIEHDMDLVMSVSDRILVMHEGALIADGPPAVIQGDSAVIDAYLGSRGTRESGRTLITP